MQINFQKMQHIKTVGKMTDIEAIKLPEVVLAGRSNVGKSSLINALGNNKNLARVSSSPGKTRLILYFEVDNAFVLTDLPGYGYAKADKETINEFNQLTDDYLTYHQSISLVLFLLDIRHEPSAQDELMFDFLNSSGLPYAVVLTKADKLSKNQIRQRINAFRKFPYIGEDGVLLPVSASKKTGIKELQNFLTDYISDFVAE